MLRKCYMPILSILLPSLNSVMCNKTLITRCRFIKCIGFSVQFILHNVCFRRLFQNIFINNILVRKVGSIQNVLVNQIKLAFKIYYMFFGTFGNITNEIMNEKKNITFIFYVKNVKLYLISTSVHKIKDKK